jgi:uncharacterized protein YbjT (DUF2867 family)
MRAFVTGAAGFVGGSLARQLIERGETVVAAVRDRERAGALAALVADSAAGLKSQRRVCTGV